MNKSSSVRDVMSTPIMTVADDMATDALALYLIEHEISGAPVVDDQGHLVGIVSMTDVGRHVAEQQDDASLPGPERYRDDLGGLTLAERRDVGAVVRDVMTPAVSQVPVTASVAAAARLMVDLHVHRLVVTQGKQPVGIITSMDLLRSIAG